MKQKSPPTKREILPQDSIQQKILLIDIETKPNLGYVWGKWEQNVIEFKEEWSILCFGFKWLGKKTEVLTSRKNDKQLVKELWKLLNEADIVIAHNGDQFDLKKINARFSFHNLPPPSPYQSVDTLKVARRYFAFTSNKLGDLGEYLGLGSKEQTGGFNLWKGCMAGDEKAWKKMIKYNRQDVDLLEKLYLHLRPWIKNHPYTGGMCQNCGSNSIQLRGISLTKKRRYQRFQCKDCGGWGKW